MEATSVSVLLAIKEMELTNAQVKKVYVANCIANCIANRIANFNTFYSLHINILLLFVHNWRN